jgi:hypothetical protein
MKYNFVGEAPCASDPQSALSVAGFEPLNGAQRQFGAVVFRFLLDRPLVAPITNA